MASLGSEIQTLCNAVQARLNGHPDTATEWLTIARQLRTAADKARKIAKLAERMEYQLAGNRILPGYVEQEEEIDDYPPYAGE